MTTENDITIQNQVIEHARELLITHWNEAKDSADDAGKFSIGLRISVEDGAPVKLKVACRISKTITDGNPNSLTVHRSAS